MYAGSKEFSLFIPAQRYRQRNHFGELTGIAKTLEDEAISVDEPAAKVKRAAELVVYCKNKLQSAETQVNEIINHIDKEN